MLVGDKLMSGLKSDLSKEEGITSYFNQVQSISAESTERDLARTGSDRVFINKVSFDIRKEQQENPIVGQHQASILFMGFCDENGINVTQPSFARMLNGFNQDGFANLTEKVVKASLAELGDDTVYTVSEEQAKLDPALYQELRDDDGETPLVIRRRHDISQTPNGNMICVETIKVLDACNLNTEHAVFQTTYEITRDKVIYRGTTGELRTEKAKELFPDRDKLSFIEELGNKIKSLLNSLFGSDYKPATPKFMFFEKKPEKHSVVNPQTAPVFRK